jgi:hypothetical protein
MATAFFFAASRRATIRAVIAEGQAAKNEHAEQRAQSLPRPVSHSATPYVCIIHAEPNHV